MSALRWERDGANWPNAHASQFVKVGGLNWHVQMMGSGPDLLLLHGTGASTHSWRNFATLLARSFRVISPDLPGHGFTATPSSHDLSLPGMAGSVSALLRSLDVDPILAVGHSAGAAIGCRMELDNAIRPKAQISINGALLPFGGAASHVFPFLARMLFVNPFVPSFLAWRAHDTNTVKHLIANTGSSIDEEGLALYGRLFQSSGHVASALSMMAHWDLRALARELPALRSSLTLIAAADDKAVPPDVAFKVNHLVPRSRVVLIRGAGHLLHEEKPHETAREVFAAAEGAGLQASVLPKMSAENDVDGHAEVRG